MEKRSEAMNTKLVRAVGVIAAAMIGGVAAAQQNAEVTVQAKRIVEKPMGTSITGIPITSIEVSYTVGTSDLNLALIADAAKLEKRVKDAAMAACLQISLQYRLHGTDDAACAKAATESAMVKVHALIASAGAKPAK
jgi:UrcA family protein